MSGLPVDSHSLTKNVNKITCKTDNYVPLLVPGLSTSSDSSSSFTSKPHVPQLFLKDREQHHQIQWQIDVTNLQLGNHCWQTLTNLQLGNHLLDTKDRMETEDPTQGIPEWLQDFTANLEDLERHAPGHIPEGAHSDSEGSLKSGWQFRITKHSIFTNFPKDRNCDVCLWSKNTISPCRRHHQGSIPRAEKFGDLKTADDKVLNEGSESQNNHRYAVVVQDLVTQWIQPYPWKT